VKVAVGEPTQISIRPERVCLEPQDSEISVEGTIAEVIYLGDHIRIRMQVFDDENFIVKLSNGAGRRAFTVGDTVRVGWSVEDGRALDV
jgi:putative spermidine/putrescine transport system ATP-binding protein